MRSKVPTLVVLCLLAGVTTVRPAAARPDGPADAAHIQLALQRLNVLGSVLYLAAHPDDENTAALAYFENERLFRTAYLAVTRGDGGQNLIGTEQAELMGVLRTQELLAARRIDGAQQFFTRANDFGYSKNTEEALSVWGHEEILADVVWVIRTFRPDVIITRFTPQWGGHGHHTASALLAQEAFEAAGDPARFPEQLQHTQIWSPKRLMADSRGNAAVTVDLGVYNPLLGASYTEIAARSRSQHKSQGFGSTPRRGPSPDSFTLTAGAPATSDVFDEVDTSWGRIPGGRAVGDLIAKATAAFRPAEPSAVVPTLLDALDRLDTLSDGYWKRVKREELLDVIRDCMGLWLSAEARDWAASPGGSVVVAIEAVNRSPISARIRNVGLSYPAATVSSDTAPGDLVSNHPVDMRVTVRIPEDAPISQPYWLDRPPLKGRYQVTDPRLIGQPESPPAMTATFRLTVAGHEVEYVVPVDFRWTDPVRGEQRRDFLVAPPVVLDLGASAIVFGDRSPRTLEVGVEAIRSGSTGTVSLELPRGWTAAPSTVAFNLEGRGDRLTARFEVTPGPDATPDGRITAVARIDGAQVSRGMKTVDYAHIPLQVLFPDASARLVQVDLEGTGGRIGYVMGPGDEVPEALRQIGYRVDLLDDADLIGGDLSVYETIVTGVRAYNTRDVLGRAQPRLMEYVRGGGTMIVQYNNNRGLAADPIGPYPIQLSRDRVTVEEAPVTFIDPAHPLLTGPNRITTEEFNGWVQERGLYFAGSWDDRYQSVWSSHDPGEQPLGGGMLYARYGEGVFMYSAYDWFRQLPAGVPGAYRLFVNMLAAGRSR